MTKDEIVTQLLKYKDRIEAAIEALTGEVAAVPPPGKRSAQQTEEYRKAQARRMRAHWRKRKVAA